MSGKSVILNSGHQMPLLGLGCWQTEADKMSGAVKTALDAGYRHIDTAALYMNEEGVGAGIKDWSAKSGGKREDVFVVTKLPNVGLKPDKVETFLRKSLKALNLSYLDLYLIHHPVGLKGKDDNDLMPFDENMHGILDPGTDLIACWKAMEKLVDLGLTKSIGVSNFNVKQMTKICAVARIPPATNQVEMHVYMQQRELHKFCKERNIYLTAYSPLGSPGTVKTLGEIDGNPKVLLNDPVVALVAERHQVTPAQILIKFLVQQQVVAIPKSITPSRIKSNFDVWGFTLTDVEIAALRSKDMGESGRLLNSCVKYGLMSHPECPY